MSVLFFVHLGFVILFLLKVDVLLVVELSQLCESSLIRHKRFSSYNFSKFQILDVELAEFVEMSSDQISKEYFLR